MMSWEDVHLSWYNQNMSAWDDNINYQYHDHNHKGQAPKGPAMAIPNEIPDSNAAASVFDKMDSV